MAPARSTWGNRPQSGAGLPQPPTPSLSGAAPLSPPLGAQGRAARTSSRRAPAGGSVGAQFPPRSGRGQPHSRSLPRPRLLRLPPSRGSQPPPRAERAPPGSGTPQRRAAGCPPGPASSSAAAPPRPPCSGLRRRPRPLRQLGDREEPAGRVPRDRAGLTEAAPPPPGPACRVVPWSVCLTFPNVSALGQHGQGPPVVFKTLFCFWFPFSLSKKLETGSHEKHSLLLIPREWAGFPTPSSGPAAGNQYLLN
ncbi:uncharacterized protein LOC128848656 [Malaclemys terrapin pileata]|uniref:uncharacterized protein LOC128848656 n=1 Tax=Malaclemys terrapin pileata TaxID=2991368 RepID=UPI0023A8B4A0|nr:uncharacterized protein LOC128848656 [Malaclemys terrapin pileata]